MWHTQRYLRDITLHWEQSVSKVLYVFDEAFQYQWEDWIGTYQKNSNLGKSPIGFFLVLRIYIHCSWKRDHKSTFVINFFFATFFFASYNYKFYRKYTRETCLKEFIFKLLQPAKKKIEKWFCGFLTVTW